MSRLAYHAELAALLSAWVDGSLTDAGQSRMEHLMRTDAGADFALAWLDQHATLSATSTSKPDISDAKVRMDRPVSGSNFSSFIPKPFAPIALSLAATLLLTAAAVAIYVFAINPQSEIDKPKSAAPIATLIESTDRVSYEDDIAYEGEEYASGTYSIESGSAQFLLGGNVSVHLRGTTRIQMHSPMEVSLERGSAGFECPPGSEGFTVHLPGGWRAVDLGTAFSAVATGEGRTSVAVTSGRVEMRIADRVYPLNAGGVATIDRENISTGFVVLADALNGPSDAPLDGTPVATARAAANWIAAAWRADGSIAPGASANAFAPFTPEPGYVYTLSCVADVTAAEDPSRWFALGFSGRATPDQPFYAVEHLAPWMLLRLARGPSAVQAFIDNRLDSPHEQPAGPGPVHLAVKLDTTHPRWRTRWFIDHAPTGEPVELETRPDIRFVGFGRYDNTYGTIRDFRLTAVRPDSDPPIDPAASPAAND